MLKNLKQLERYDPGIEITISNISHESQQLRVVISYCLEDNQRVTYTYTVVLTSPGYLACKRRAVLGADTAAELGSLPI
jgi:hypothetical protein